MNKNTIKDTPLVTLLKEQDTLIKGAVRRADIDIVKDLLELFYFAGKKQGLINGMTVAKKYLG